MYLIFKLSNRFIALTLSVVKMRIEFVIFLYTAILFRTVTNHEPINPVRPVIKIGKLVISLDRFVLWMISSMSLSSIMSV